MEPGANREPGSASNPPDRLDSWKEIASYLNRGVRTVVRWEAEEGLPVHRLQHDERASIYAFRSELDAWQQSRTRSAEPQPQRRASPIPSLVVLPFADLSPRQQDEYFCDGLAEELTNALGRVPGLQVISRTSAFAFRGQPVDIGEITRHLKVSAVVEGAVRRSEGRLRVTVQLIHSADRTCIWSECFDRASGEIFAIQSEIGEAVVAALRICLLGADRARLVRHHTSDPEAYDLYLRGRYLLARRTLPAIDAAIDCLRQSLDRSPGNALAYAALAECHCVIGFLGLRPPGDAFAAATDAVARGSRLDPNLGELLAIDGYIGFVHDWDWAGAEAKLKRAQTLSPSYAPAALWMSFLLSVRGRHKEAEAAIARAWELDPLSLYVQTHVGLAALWARHYDRAIARFHNVLALEPDYALANFHLGRALLMTGRKEQGMECLERAAAALPIATGALASAHAAAGRRAESEAMLARLRSASESRFIGALAFAVAYMVSAPDRAMDYFKSALEAREGAVVLFGVDPGFDSFRSRAGFRDLLHRLRLAPGRGRG